VLGVRGDAARAQRRFPPVPCSERVPPVADTELDQELDRPLSLHPLRYLVDGGEVTIGRADIDSYAIFPPDGAELVRRLEAGATPGEAARWYEAEYGESADVGHVVAALDELGFLRTAEEAPAAAGPVRWQRLGRALFSWPAWVGYGLVVAWALVSMARHTDLVPTYRMLMFTDYIAVIDVTLMLAAIPMSLLHEAFHALAGRRLGLRSRLSIGRRFYFVVLETSLDGLVAVPRRQRYLPILAGMLADLVLLAALTVAADLTRMPGGGFSLVGKLCLAFGFATLMRMVWQFYFYLRTDIYVLVTTALGCVDLHTTAKQLLANRVNAALGRRDRLVDEAGWHPADRRAARWYSWLVLVGYCVSLAALVLALAPAAYMFFSEAIGRLFDAGTPGTKLVDSAVFLSLSLLQIAFTVWVGLRERRRRRTFDHVIA
jgi:hypothetical protein